MTPTTFIAFTAVINTSTIVASSISTVTTVTLVGPHTFLILGIQPIGSDAGPRCLLW